jgi:hypothetical protein
MYLTGSASATVDSAIIYSVPTGNGITVDSGVSFTGTYNDVYGNSASNYSGVTDPTGTSGNISTNPTFTAVSDDGDPYNDDWSLDASSPAVDAGDPSLVDPDGSTADMGAYGGAGGSWK